MAEVLRTEPTREPERPVEASDPWPVEWVPVEGDKSGPWAWVEYVLLRAVLALVGALPRFVALPLAGLLTRLCYALDRGHNESARSFLRQAFGPETPDEELERRTMQAWRYLWRLVFESMSFERHRCAKLGDHFTDEIAPHVRRTLDREGGYVLVTPHLGNWEVAGLGLGAIGLGPLYAISKPPRNRPLSRYAQRLRDRRALRLIPRKGAMRLATRVLRTRAAICIMIDQKPRRRWVEAPFFGRRARCDRSAAVLVKRMGVPVVIGACLFGDRPYRYVLRSNAVLQPEEVASSSLEEVVTRINREMEALILGAPDQYLWLHDRY